MTASRSLLALLLLAASFLACGGEASDGGKDVSNGEAATNDPDETGGVVECVFADGACPEGCTELKGTPVDERGCPGEPELLGCAGPGAGFPDAVGCYVHVETGKVYSTPNLYHLSGGDFRGFRECSEAERIWSDEKACEEGLPVCELQGDGACPAGCMALEGWPFDETLGCLGESETIGCVEPVVGYPPSIGCQVEIATGTVYATPALFPLLDGFRACGEDEASAVSAEFCE